MGGENFNLQEVTVTFCGNVDEMSVYFDMLSNYTIDDAVGNFFVIKTTVMMIIISQMMIIIIVTAVETSNLTMNCNVDKIDRWHEATTVCDIK
jgi:hypothetical protein